MKNAKVIFSKRHNFATSCEEITGEDFVSQFSEDSNRFTTVNGEISNALFEELSQKAGKPDYRVVLTLTADDHTGDIGGVPTINVHISDGKLLKKAV
jgi:hypothetical protein